MITTLTPYQIIVPLVAVVAIVYAWNLMLRQRKSIWESCLWTIFWGLIAIIAIEPGILTYLTAVTGIKSQVNAALATAIGILFFLIFSMIIRIEELEQRLTRVIRALAIRNAELGERHEEKDRR
ncbi:MAG: hypothetical protein G01um101425_51 [Candidatus Peregrinibacteria bacterium Gr01-1014_25]|nr:MAG: hypothetical protein G01um101425_51 [Candidatus Peregrinibacteria bacterium Gr01-1014_25]